LNRSTTFAGRVAAAPLNAEARDGLLAGERPAAMEHALLVGDRWAPPSGA